VLGIFGSIVAMVLWVGGTLVTFLLIHTFWPPTHRRSHNEIVGWQMSVIGTTYAVILGFMLYNVWDNFRTADLNADQEANALVSIYRLAEGLPDSSRKEVQAAARRYATIVVQEEWPDMSRRAFSPAGAAVTQELWETIVKVGREPSSQSATFMQVVAQLAMNIAGSGTLKVGQTSRSFCGSSFCPAVLSPSFLRVCFHPKAFVCILF
jgi:hypothetical protein